MRLVASAIVRNERHRYFDAWVQHLHDFVDAIVLLDDGSTDDTAEWFTLAHARPYDVIAPNDGPSFEEHEGKARQRLLELTLARRPTHVLAIDADEFVADGALLRRSLRSGGPSWTLEMGEVWELDGDCLCVRVDGLWRPYRLPSVWQPDQHSLSFPDQALAVGRVPTVFRRQTEPVTEILHFGWANPAARQARYDRYMRIDAGKYHDLTHLRSIMAPNVALDGRPWPTSLQDLRPLITKAAA